MLLSNVYRDADCAAVQVTGLGTPDFDRLLDALVAGGDEATPVSNRNSQNAATGTWTVFLLMPIYAVLWTCLMFRMGLYL